MTGIVILVLEWTVTQMTLNESTRMTLNEAIEICQARIDLDRSMRDNKVESDYDEFCENECIAIERLIEECKIKERR